MKKKRLLLSPALLSSLPALGCRGDCAVMAARLTEAAAEGGEAGLAGQLDLERVFTVPGRCLDGLFPSYCVDFPCNPSGLRRKISLSDKKIRANPASLAYEYKFLDDTVYGVFPLAV